MRGLLTQLLMPLSIFWLMVFFSVLLLLFKKRSAGYGVMVFSLIWLWIFSAGPVPDMLMKSLEQRYTALVEIPEDLLDGREVHIMVLGGGHVSDQSLPPSNQLNVTALGRLMEGIRVHTAIPGSKLIVSGGSGFDSTDQAEVLAQAAISFGVDESSIIKLGESTNTFQEARAYFNKFGVTYPLVVVTSASHMHRAIWVFENRGLSPVAAPANHKIKDRNVRYPYEWIPKAEKIRRSERAFHEYIGILWYRLTAN